MEQVFVFNSAEFYHKQQEFIKKAIEEVLKTSNSVQEDVEVMQITDVAKLLKKSRQTIINWSDQGILKRHYIADSVFYLRSEVLNSMTDTRSPKHIHP